MRDVGKSQYFTPSWAAEMLVARHFSDLRPGKDIVLDPTCGDGRFLMALPRGVEAFGVELDETLIADARANTGREILCGDFATIELPRRPTAIITNPPFSADFLDVLLDRAAELLDENGRMGLLLPVYLFQTASSVMRYSRHFSINQELIPRNIFKDITKPLMWATFTRAKNPVLSGFFMYEEVSAIEQVKARYRTHFVGNNTRAHMWGALVEEALISLGGEASLQDIYTEIEGKRPSDNAFWREQIRKVCRQFYQRVGQGRYRLERVPQQFDMLAA